jgi:Bacteriophage holin family
MISAVVLKKWMFALGATGLAFVAPVQTIMALGCLLVVLDLIAGVARAVSQKQKLTSSKLKRSIVKSVLYMVAILGGYVF